MKAEEFVLSTPYGLAMADLYTALSINMHIESFGEDSAVSFPQPVRFETTVDRRDEARALLKELANLPGLVSEGIRDTSEFAYGSLSATFHGQLLIFEVMVKWRD